MPAVTFMTAAGRVLVVEAATGQSLLSAALAHDVDGILGECGGCLSCGTCHVYIDPRFTHMLPSAGSDEQVMLELATELRGNSRLCCQITMTVELDGLVLQIAAQQP
jgi:2Fe-2S ferredoxin